MGWLTNTLDKLCSFLNLPASSECAVAHHNEDLSGLKVAELRAMAKSRGLKGYTGLKKADLVNLLNN